MPVGWRIDNVGGSAAKWLLADTASGKWKVGDADCCCGGSACGCSVPGNVALTTTAPGGTSCQMDGAYTFISHTDLGGGACQWTWGVGGSIGDAFFQLIYDVIGDQFVFTVTDNPGGFDRYEEVKASGPRCITDTGKLAGTHTIAPGAGGGCPAYIATVTFGT